MHSHSVRNKIDKHKTFIGYTDCMHLIETKKKRSFIKLKNLSYNIRFRFLYLLHNFFTYYIIKEKYDKSL